MSDFKTLFFDIETSLISVYTFGIGHNMSISHDQIHPGDYTDIMCICYKWAHEKKVHSLDWGINKQDSKPMIKEFDKILKEADVVIGHNGDKFDMRQVNTQRLLKKLPPLDWVPTEDTLKQFRKHFNLPSYRLDYIAKLLTGAGKSPMCLQDWIDIKYKHSQKALDKMIKYCKQDVRILQQVHDIAAPYTRKSVHRGVATGKTKHGSCPACGNDHFIKHGVYTNTTGRYQRYKCQSCGHAFKDSRRLK